MHAPSSVCITCRSPPRHQLPRPSTEPNSAESDCPHASRPATSPRAHTLFSGRARYRNRDRPSHEYSSLKSPCSASCRDKPTTFPSERSLQSAALPVDVAITPDGQGTAFVAMLDATEVAIFDVASGTVIGGLPVATSAMRALRHSRWESTFTSQPQRRRRWCGRPSTTSTLVRCAHRHNGRWRRRQRHHLRRRSQSSVRDRAGNQHWCMRSMRRTTSFSGHRPSLFRRLRFRPVAPLLLGGDGRRTPRASRSTTAPQVLERSIPSTSGAFGLKVTPDGKQLYLTRRSPAFVRSSSSTLRAW